MGHKKESLERWLSKITLAQTGYGHFYIEHNRGHHVRVATPEDPASARFGETFWEFLPRSVFGSLRSACAAGGPADSPAGRQSVEPEDLPVQRRPQRLADDRRAVGRAAGGVRPGADPVPDHPGGLRHSACWRRSTTSSTTDSCGRRTPTAATSAARPSTAGTPTTSSPTCCCTTCSGTATTTPTRPGATRRCAAWTVRRTCRSGYGGADRR